MQKALITGVTGFVGGYLANHLLDLDYEVWGTTTASSKPKLDNINLVTLDVTDADGVKKVVTDIAPAEIYHLAAITRPALGLVSELYNTNLYGTLNVLEAAKLVNAAILVVSSAYVYGRHDSIITEMTPLKPMNHYGASKAATDLAAISYALQGFRVVRARPFNHSGPGQSPDFLLPTLINQIARIEAGLEPPCVKLGNLDSIRDFTDVRDIVKAYAALLKYATSGEAYNLASGKGVSVKSLFSKISKLTDVTLEVEVTENRVRPIDIPYLVGDATKAFEAINWKPQVSLEETLSDMIFWSRKNLGN